MPLLAAGGFVWRVALYMVEENDAWCTRQPVNGGWSGGFNDGDKYIFTKLNIICIYVEEQKKIYKIIKVVA